MKKFSFYVENFRISILAFSQQHMMITVRDKINNDKLFPTLTMSDGNLYGNLNSFQNANSEDSLKTILASVKKALNEWNLWENISANTLGENIVLY